MSRDEDLGRINRSHPDRGQHEFYDEKAVFPLNLSDLLEKSGDRWWEGLGKYLFPKIPPPLY